MKIFNIGKANAEIERLQESLKQSQEEIATLKENATALEKGAESEKARADKAEESAKTAGSDRIAALEKENTELKARAEKAEKEKAEHCKEFDDKVEKAASAKALQITASQGQPAVATPKVENPEQKPGEGLKGLSAVTEIFKSQIAAFNAAHK